MADLGVVENGLEGRPVGVGVDAAAAVTEAAEAAVDVEPGLPMLPESSRLLSQEE